MLSRLTSSTRCKAEIVASRDIIEAKNAMQGKLMAPRTPHDRSFGELSWRTMRAQEHHFEVPVRFRRTHEWQQAREDWYKVETKLIWAAFDAPEKIPILLRDEVIRGHRAVFEDPKWLERAVYWTKEARYWRVLGITHPFYDRDTLRVFTWEDKGQAFGQPVINSAMRDAISDLERAKKRKDLGLDPNYVWDRWGPNGFIDGARSDYLPRFQFNPYSDPDNVDVEPDELNAINSHEQIRQRYKEFIWLDDGEASASSTSKGISSSTSSSSTSPFQDSFTTVTNGYLELHDFSDEVRRFYFTANLGPAREGGDASMAEVEQRKQQEDKLLQSTDDIRALIYLSAQFEELEPRFEEWLEKNSNSSIANNNNINNNVNEVNGNANKWELFKQFITPLREACDAKVEACRLLHWCSRDSDQAREFFAEKCGFVDFMMTTDKILTAASIAQLKTIQSIALNHEWGLPLCLALTDKEKAAAIGIEAYSAWREFEDLCIDRRRRAFTQRHAAPANEEKTLDFLLQQFARRPQRESLQEKATLGSEFDRETEPIGRGVQRRVLASDVMEKSKVDKDSTPRHGLRGTGRFEAKSKSKGGIVARKTGTTADAYASLRSNQFSGQTRSF